MEIKLNDIKFNISNDKINGIYTNNIDKVIKLLKIDDINTKIDNKKLSKQDIYNYKKSVYVIDEYIDNYNELTIYDVLLSIINNYNIYPKNINKKIKDAIKIVGLKEEILTLGIKDISSSEQKLIQLAISLLVNTNTIILIEPFKVLDINNRKRIIILLQKLLDKYKKSIIIISNDVEILLKYTKNLIIIKNNKLVVEGNTFEIFTDVELLKKHHIEIPEIIEITYLTKKLKNVKIDYFIDIRNIIKDIYKHV